MNNRPLRILHIWYLVLGFKLAELRRRFPKGNWFGLIGAIDEDE